MPTMRIECTAGELLRAVEQLPSGELEQFVGKVLAVRASRMAPTLSADESGLLETIGNGLSPADQARFDDLIRKRQSETLTPEEHAALLALSDESERWQVKRLQALVELARIRHVSVDELMERLGIGATPDG